MLTTLATRYEAKAVVDEESLEFIHQERLGVCRYDLFTWGNGDALTSGRLGFKLIGSIVADMEVIGSQLANAAEAKDICDDYIIDLCCSCCSGEVKSGTINITKDVISGL